MTSPGAEPNAPSFVAVDVETANSSYDSICAVGAVVVYRGEIADGFYTLVDPKDEFSPTNVGIHGIASEAVVGAPEFPAVWRGTLRRMFAGRVVAAHTHFDRACFRRVFEKYALAGHDDGQWLDTCQVAKQQWPDLPNHKLPTVAAHLGISFDHHHALEDARAAAGVLIQACRQSAKGIAYWQR